MTIRLELIGDHMTDLVSEVRTLAAVFGMVDQCTTPVEPQDAEFVEVEKDMARATALAEKGMAENTPAPTTGTGPEKKTLNRKEQDEAVEEMIENGKDDRFDMLTRGRQKKVETALTKAMEKADVAKTEEDDLDDMFSDGPDEVVITRDQVSELMGKIGKDENGLPVQERLLKIREILVDNIPEGENIKVRNIPEDKLTAVFNLINKIEV